MYSINGAYPVSKIPYQLFDSDGRSRTSLSEDSARRFGCIKVDNPPDYNVNTHQLNWDSVNHWEVISLDSDMLLHNKNSQWQQIRIRRNSMIEDIHMVNARNKLKVYKGPPVECKYKEKYKRNKYLSVEYTKNMILNEEEKFIELFTESKKKDDLADAYLQGIYFIDTLT